MRATCFELLLLFAAILGCASPEGESSGFMGNYGGFPWPSLLKKNADQNNDASFFQPSYTGSGRFTRPPAASVGTVSPNQAAATQPPAAQAPATQAASTQAPAEKSSSDE